MTQVNANMPAVSEGGRMWSYYPELLATPVPRYTSYPTAAEFHDGIGVVDQAEGLAGIGEEEAVSLYLHIPYCREICWYCGCNTGAANRTQRLANYLEALGQEINLVSRKLGGRGTVARVAFGGGSPNAISPAQLLDLTTRLRSAFRVDGDAIWSIEIDPRGFDKPFADALTQAGFRRASLGVQTFDEEIQRAIGRVQPASDIARATSLLRDAGVQSLNYDLMYGLPGQSEAVLEATLEQALAFGADRLAVFGYAHVPHLLPRQRRIDASALPNSEQRFRQAELAHRTLTRSDMVAIGFDHFARPDDPMAHAARDGRVRRNFQGFTDDSCDTLIGLGASSISRFRGSLVQNERNSGRYGLLVGNDQLAAVRGVATLGLERRRAALIEELLCQGRADLGRLPDLAAIKAALAPFSDSRLIVWHGDRLRLASGSAPYARAVAATLDPWRKDSGVRFSSAV